MNEDIARRILREEVALLRQESYESLRDRLLEHPSAKDRVGPDGRPYEVEVEAFWDCSPGGDLRVVVSVSDGRGWRQFFPLTEDLLVSPQGGQDGIPPR